MIQANALCLPLRDQSVHCCVTSPPYWGLRDYGLPPTSWPDGWRGCLGLEPTPELYVEHIVECMREVKRVLRDDAALWLNLGDSFADKQLQGIPWRVAFALQADGWWLRSDIIWHKPNPMPESVRDRPTKSHEYMFLLSKSKRYYWDQEAVREPNANPSRTNYTSGRGRIDGDAFRCASGDNHRGLGATGRPIDEYAGNGRNIRSVWTISTRPYSGAHFAVFPPDLVEPCIKAGSSERGCCPKCGAPWERVVEKESTIDTGRLQYNRNIGQQQRQSVPRGVRKGDGGYDSPSITTTGWRPTCDCPGLDGDSPGSDCADDDNWPTVPCRVLDPFGGSGTVAQVAIEQGRVPVCCELNWDYIGLAQERTATVQPVLL